MPHVYAARKSSLGMLAFRLFILIFLCVQGFNWLTCLPAVQGVLGWSIWRRMKTKRLTVTKQWSIDSRMNFRIGLPTPKLRFRQLIRRSGVQAILYCEEVHDLNPLENKALSRTFSVQGEEHFRCLVTFLDRVTSENHETWQK